MVEMAQSLDSVKNEVNIFRHGRVNCTKETGESKIDFLLNFGNLYIVLFMLS